MKDYGLGTCQFMSKHRVFSSCFIQGNTDISLLIIPAYAGDTKISVAI